MMTECKMPEWWPFKPGTGTVWTSNELDALRRSVVSGRLPKIIVLGDWLDNEPNIHINLGMPTEILLSLSSVNRE